MTYENAMKWLLDDNKSTNVKFFKNYKEWEEQAKDELQTPNLWESKKFLDMLHSELRKRTDWTDIGKRRPRTRREQTFQTVEDRKGTFTTTQVYELNESRPRPSIRRELQELVKSGKLVRVSKGVYTLP